MATPSPGDGLPQAICSTFEDAARAVRACIEVPLGPLPSRLEAFFILPDAPYGVYSNEKAKALLEMVADERKGFQNPILDAE